MSQPFSFSVSFALRLGAFLFRPSRASGHSPWVIGGHRGRLHADNAGELHDFLLRTKSIPVIWVGNGPVVRQLHAQGIPTLRRNSLSAKLAILRAPVVIYSHGEDDLDQYALLWRKALGFRVYLNHCLNHLKAGQCMRKDFQAMGFLRRALFRWTMVDFDLLPASSELERKHFVQSLPHLESRIKVGGGAHLDGIIRRSQEPTDRRLLWFPTFREGREERLGLEARIREVMGNAALVSWLRQEHRTLFICRHINSGYGDFATSADSPIQLCPASALDEMLAHSELLISDYSGVSTDWLVMDRPAIFFPFDMDAYLRHRNFYISYEDYHYGPLVHDSAELVRLLVSNQWQNLAPWTERRAYWKSRMFPMTEPGYAASTFAVIQQHLSPSAEGNRNHL
ncbi:MAG TPA: CDP-glycerol glycerophosphotransferase family protein [Fibrobacteraceae bacterium]|nr:CDP-glycerol glycerophosphotransferase family protein [Fibrobacteraceae bacterium]